MSRHMVGRVPQRTFPQANQAKPQGNSLESGGYCRFYGKSKRSERQRRGGVTMKRPAIRPAEILGHEHDSATGLIKIVKVAAVFRQAPDLPKNSGNLIFRCPFCHAICQHSAGNAQFTGAVKPIFGAYNGPRAPHCECGHFSQGLAAHTPEIYSRLSPGWQFHLIEVENPDRAGSFPWEIRKQLAKRGRSHGGGNGPA